MKTFSSVVFLVIFCHVSSSSDPHPYGASLKILSMVDNNGAKQYITETENIERVFLHPEMKDRKIVVLSIIGAYRRGKSFFLDYCLRFLYANYRSINNFNESKPIAGDWIGDGNTPLQGFSWKHGRTADTKGMIMWSDVFLHDTPTEKIAIVIMDTQGLFEPGSTAAENGRIFGLSTLVSSIQILNIKEVLQEDHLEYLETATNLAQKIVKTQKSTKWKPFQKLLFLFRDWVDDSIEYGYGGGQKYLNFEILKEIGNENAKANVIRKNIRDSFDEISCFLLNHPGLKISKGHGEWSSLEGDFVSNLKFLIESLLSPKKLIKKSNLGKDLTADEFQTLMKVYFDAFANAILPDTDNILQMAIDNQMQTIVNAQLKVFNQLQAELDVNYNRDDFVAWVEEVYEKNTKTAIDGFLYAEKFDDEESSNKFEDMLKAEMETVFMNWKKTAMKAYEEFQEQKRLREIEDCFNLQLKTYQEIMTNNLDFNQNDFEKYYEHLHQSTVYHSIQELEKMRFKDEMSKLNAKKSLEDRLNEKFATFKTSKINEYNQHLRVVSMFVDKQFDIYKNTLNLNLDYETRTDFETYLNKKHDNAKKSATDGFENSQLAFTPRKSQFKEKLIAMVDGEYLKLKKATMKTYQDLLDQKRQREIESCLNLQPKIYRNVMNTNIDFKQDDFNKYYEDLHQSAMANAVKELHKLTFKDERSKQSYTNSLKDEINSDYKELKESKVIVYGEHVKAVSTICDNQFEAYKTDINNNINYQSYHNFESYLVNKEVTARNLALNNFDSLTAKLSFSSRKSQYRQNLISNIDGGYQNWKATTIDTYNKKVNEKFQQFVDSKALKYKNSLNSYVQLEQLNYLNVIETRHNSQKIIILLEFKDETNFLYNANTQSTYKSQLSSSIDSAYNNWYFGKKAQHFKYIERVLQTARENKLRDYKIIKDIKDDFNDRNYESYMKNLHDQKKKTAIEQFKNENRFVVDQSRVTYHKNLLRNDIDVFNEDNMQEKMKTYNKLRNTGIWVPWNGSNKNLPEYAVVGGIDKGDRMYFARVKLYTDDGKYRGTHIGRFRPAIENVCLIPYYYRIYEFQYFEVFTHTNYKFVFTRDNNDRLIVGGYNEDSNNNIYMCRSSLNWSSDPHKAHRPGKINGDGCTVAYNNKYYQIDYEYEYMVYDRNP